MDAGMDEQRISGDSGEGLLCLWDHSPSQFKVDNLSESLSSLFDTPFDMDWWEAEYGGLLQAEEVENGYNHAIYCPPDWYLPENEISSLCLSVLKIKTILQNTWLRTKHLSSCL
jgi:hypothetical protein